jgi:hypothetical protein
MAAAALGAALGGLNTIATTIAVYVFVAGLGQAAVAARHLRESFVTILRGQWAPWIFSLIAMAPALWVRNEAVTSPVGPFLILIARGAIFSIVYAALVFIFLPGRISELLAVFPPLQRLLRRKPHAVDSVAS